MIAAKSQPPAGAFARALADKARALAEARVRSESDPDRWRAAHLLWPLFTGGK
jgi:hypothetical protein